MRPPARRERRAEDQSLSRTCPPRVVFALILTGHQREASRIQTPASHDQPPQLHSALVPATKTLLRICREMARTPSRSCRRQDLPISLLVWSAGTRCATPAALVGDGVSQALDHEEEEDDLSPNAPHPYSPCLGVGVGGGTPPPSPLSLTGRFWRAESLVTLSLAKTSGKSVDWPGGVVTSHGPLSPCRGI